MYKPKYFISHLVKWRAMLLCLCLLSGCRQEITPPDPFAGGMFISYKSESLTETEPTVRLLVFAGMTESNKTLAYNAEAKGNTGKIPLQGIKLNDIYTVINPEKDLGSIQSIEDLQSVKISENLPADVNDQRRQRYHCFENIYPHESGKITYGKNGTEDISQTILTTSEYTMAKMKVEFKLLVESDMTIADGTKLVIQKVSVKNVPSYGYLIPKPYDGTTFKEIDGNLSQPATPSATSYTASAQVLIPEYLRASAEAQKVMLVVTADRYKDGKRLGSSEYEVPVGNAIATGADLNDYNIDRNKVYTFSFTRLTGAGTQVDDWVVDKSVTTWEDRKVDTEVGDMSGFFLETTLIDNFRAFRLPRYVSFKSIGGGRVTVDKPRDAEGYTIPENDFTMDVLWDDATHKSGKLALKKGNWRTSGNFTAKIKLRANNIEKTLVINTVPTMYAQTGIMSTKITWLEAMNYTNEIRYCWSKDMNDEKLIKVYSQAWKATGGPTGCASYYEGNVDDPLTGRGCWRVATMREGLWYMREKKQEAAIWAYEMADLNDYQSYVAKVNTNPDQGSIAPFPTENDDLHHPNNANIPAFSRTGTYNRFSILCVLDDKLEMNYNVGVNASDHPLEVTFEEAQQICTNLREGGFSDWRLPTVQESTYAIVNAGTQGIPNNFNAGLYWRSDHSAAGVSNPGGTMDPPGGVANVRCVRTKW